ncbi:MAG: alpha-amylase family glycosyl hydrolase, partial [Bacillota bacterium]
TVWGQLQLIEGKIDTLISTEALLYLHDKPIPFRFSADSSFSIQVKLTNGANKIFIKISNGTANINSDTLTITLGYKLKPEVYAYASVSGDAVTLNSELLYTPDSTVSYTYIWQEDPDNPQTGLLPITQKESATLSIVPQAKRGEYYFNLFIIQPGGDTTKFRTYVTADTNGIRPFNIKNDHAEWIDKAVIYEVSPYNFVLNGKFNDITKKIAELKQLGITTLWIQPVYETHGGGQGYDITNYFSIRSDYGSEADLRALINTAKSNGLKVLFDFVANHTSIYHPYAQHSKKYGKNSHYWNYYQRQPSPPGTPYAQYENSPDKLFYNYFWDELPNLNFNNPEVQKWITEAAKYWIEKFDIDGYRFDAIWGVNARNPEFTKQLRLSLKRIKPEVFMLAEDKAPWPSVFDERFDAAFDWTETQSWVSQWVWQTAYDDAGTDNSRTIFNNTAESDRANKLRASLTNNGKGYTAKAKILRFLENNDTQHFIRHHGIERTKMAAALEFSLNGIPLIYNGQEVGANLPHPYSTSYIYNSGQSIKSQDKTGLFSYYQKLIQLRRSVPALYGNNFEEINVTPTSSLFAYRRWENDQNVFAVTNMSSVNGNATLSIPVSRLNLDTTKLYYLSDMVNGSVQSGKLKDFTSLQVSLDRYSTKLFLLADTAMVPVGVENSAAMASPGKFELAQNYPNPFNPSTIIRYSVPKAGEVSLRVYDILGKEVATLLEGFVNAGEYFAEFDGQKLSSGIYICNIRFEGQSISKKMMLVK